MTELSSTQRAAAHRLLKEYNELSQQAWVDIKFKDDKIFEWDVALMVLEPKSRYHGGFFKAVMKFPDNYPFAPPKFRFIRPLFHPNIYPDGRLCISILHSPGEDEMSGESAAERWSSAQNVESILISILSLLDDAEVSSSANVDAGVILRENPKEYDERVKHDVEKSKLDIPPGFVMPTMEMLMEQEAAARQKEEPPNDDFWLEDNEDNDDIDDMFDGVDSDSEDAPLDDSDSDAVDDDDAAAAAAAAGDAGGAKASVHSDAKVADKGAKEHGVQGKNIEVTHGANNSNPPGQKEAPTVSSRAASGSTTHGADNPQRPPNASPTQTAHNVTERRTNPTYE